MMEINERIWTIARDAAFRVDFIINAREIDLYARAIYAAMMWGWGEQIKEIEDAECQFCDFSEDVTVGKREN